MHNRRSSGQHLSLRILKHFLNNILLPNGPNSQHSTRRMSIIRVIIRLEDLNTDGKCSDPYITILINRCIINTVA